MPDFTQEDIDRRNAEADAFVARLRAENPDDADYLGVLEAAVKERLRVNLGLMAEAQELRRASREPLARA